ncbi:hypothetical protein [Nocardia sp. NPDC051832]|uniref:hypothetical protein n=1 Tax=Nocardia sp. NPDC051832 TaxID=3155673 RepID=UPI00343EEF35
MLRLAPEDAIRQLCALLDLAGAKFFAALPRPPKWVVLGPTFAASELCRADADVIVEGLLIDIKTVQGRADPKSGERADTLPRATIHQLVGYTLFDTTDHYRLHSAGVYSARYGVLHTWKLQELLDTLAGTPVDLPAERATVRELLLA